MNRIFKLVPKGAGYQVRLPSSIYSGLFQYIAFGSKHIACEIEPHENKTYIEIGEAIWKQLMIPFEAEVHVYAKNKTLYIGPLIGMLTSGFSFSSNLPFGEHTPFYEEMILAGKEYGCFYFIFGTDHMDWQSETVQGWFYHKKEWLQVPVPIPNAIYNRLPNRKEEAILPELNSKIQKRFDIPLFNPHFFDKGYIQTILSGNSETNRLLPVALVSPSADDIKCMLQKYRSLFIKPIHGSRGQGIQQILQTKNGEFYARFRKDGVNRLRKFLGLTPLLQHQLPHSPDSYLIQQTIRLINKDGCPIDFRVHTNKNVEGKWEVSAAAAKQAAAGSYTTHVSSGGTIMTLHEMERDYSSPGLCYQLHEAALQVSNVIDQEAKGNIGELGMDFGMDLKGSLWLFEANSKPGRSIFKHPSLAAEQQRTRQMPLEYASCLFQQKLLDSSK